MITDIKVGDDFCVRDDGPNGFNEFFCCNRRQPRRLKALEYGETFKIWSINYTTGTAEIINLKVRTPAPYDVVDIRDIGARCVRTSQRGRDIKYTVSELTHRFFHVRFDSQIDLTMSMIKHYYCKTNNISLGNNNISVAQIIADNVVANKPGWENGFRLLEKASGTVEDILAFYQNLPSPDKYDHLMITILKEILDYANGADPLVFMSTQAFTEVNKPDAVRFALSHASIRDMLSDSAYNISPARQQLLSNYASQIRHRCPMLSNEDVYVEMAMCILNDTIDTSVNPLEASGLRHSFQRHYDSVGGKIIFEQ